MKRIILIMLGLLLLVSSVAFAEVDLSDMSLEELIELHENTLIEMENKGYRKSAILEMGVYKVGLDFPSGTYTIELSETADPDSFGYFNYTIIDADGQDIAHDVFCVTAIKISMEEGYTLEIERSPVRIKTFSVSWE